MQQNALQLFLNANYDTPARLETIVDDFLEEFGVMVKIEEGEGQQAPLFLFKYHQLQARWDRAVTHQCRGTILSFDPDFGWHYQSRPFDKFFNLHEAQCPLSDDDAFAAHLLGPDLLLAEKVDGSLIQLWYDEYQGRWRVSTSGTITSSRIHRSQTTFEELFWQNHPMTSDENPAVLELFQSGRSPLDPACTYLFELHSFINMVVTDYSRPRLVLLAIREKESGKYREWDFSMHEGVFEFPRTFSAFKELGILTKEGLLTWIETELSNDPEYYGFLPEGFVLLDSRTHVPLAKIKTPAYVQAHRMNDPDRWEGTAIEAVFSGTYDDVSGVLTGTRRQEAEKRAEHLRGVLGEVVAIARLFEGQTFPTQKDYALEVQRVVPKTYQAFFYQCKDNVLSGRGLVSVFNGWLEGNAGRLTKAYLREYPLLSS